MAFCCQCGKPAGDADAFCGACGTRQPGVAGGGKARKGDFFSNIDDRLASMLCYIPVVGWIPSIVVLASQKFREDRRVRFHAFQGLYLFVGWLIVDWGFDSFWGFGHFMRFSLEGMLKMAMMFVWVFMIFKTSQRVDFRLPLVGELAERSLSEQR